LIGVAVFGRLSARTGTGMIKFQKSCAASATAMIHRRITPPENVEMRHTYRSAMLQAHYEAVNQD
jgi:hypothetical protein